MTEEIKTIDTEKADTKVNTSQQDKPKSVRRRSRRNSIQRARQSLEYKEAVQSVSQSEPEIQLSKKELEEIETIAETPEEAEKLKQDAISAKANVEALRRAREQVNKSVPVEHIVNRPGFGEIYAEAAYHTHHAFRFLLGREQRMAIVDNKKQRQNQIIGLLEAASKVKRIEQGYQQGCPYAAWALVKIEQQMAQLDKLFANSQKEADQLLKDKVAITPVPFTSKTPAVIQLNFISKYAFHFANYLSQYDLLLRPVVWAKILNFIDEKEFNQIERKMGTPLRALFRLVASYEYVGKDAVAQKAAKFLEAEHKMGVLPKAILSGELRPEIAKMAQSTDLNT